MVPEFLDVEAMLVPFLSGATGERWATMVPAERPAVFGRVRRTGGQAVNRVLERAQVTCTCSAQDSPAAAAFAGKARTALLNASGALPLVRGVSEVVAPYSDPDPDTGEPRYSFTVILSVRAHSSR